MSENGGPRTVYSEVYIENAHADTTFKGLPHSVASGVAKQAMHDLEVGGGKQPFQPRKCTPNTRVKVRQNVVGWLEDSPDEHVLWLTGPAGAGKTTIARSIASPPDEEEEKDQPQDQPYHVRPEALAATFFFSSTVSQEPCPQKYLVPTLAYQLLQRLPKAAADIVARKILRKIEKDPAIFDKVLQSQFQELILKPISRLGVEERSSVPKLLIVDGVTEVGGLVYGRDIREQNEILGALLMAANNPHFAFRLLFSSRPEPNIVNRFSEKRATPALDIVTRKMFLDETYDPKADIRRYLKKDFERIYTHFYQDTGGQWPEDNVLDVLVEDSSGHFAYPAAIVFYVEHGYTDVYHPSDERSRVTKGDPLTRLVDVLGYQQSSVTNGEANLGAFAGLDYFYASVINTCPIGSTEDKYKWLRAVSRNPTLPAWFWKRFLTFYEVTRTPIYSKLRARSVLQGLDSLILIPPDDDQEKPYQFYHKTFLDFLAREELRQCPPEGQAVADLTERNDGRFQLLNVPPHFDCASQLSEFLQRCFMETLKRYGPDVESGEDETWILVFLSVIEAFQPAFDETLRCPEEDFTLCHMGSWTTRLVTQTNCKSSAISQLFQFIHSPFAASILLMATVTRPPRPPGLSLFKIYRDHITLGAIHGYCDEEFVSFGPIEGRTEHAVQRRILDWISRQRSRGSHRKKEIAFLTGSTDSRRSAVACSVAEACQKIGSLAATFIPPAESDAYSAKQFLMATLAYQMSMLDGLENFSGYVVEAIDRDIHIFTRPLRDQLDSVLLEPLRLISENEPPPLRYDPKPTSPIIVVIDNLERISLTDAAQGGDGYETLDVLLSAAGSSTFPFLILVTSGAPDWTYSFVTNRGIGFKEFSLGVGGAQGARGAGASAGMLGIHGIRREVFLGLPNVPHVPVEAQACYTQSREDTKCSCGRLHCALEKKLLFTADILGVSMAIATFFLKILQRTVLSDAPSTGLRELCSGLLTIVASIEDKAVVKDEVIGIIVDYLRVTCIVCEHFRRQNNRIAPWVHLAIDKLHCEVTQYRREMSEGVLDATRSGVDSVGVLDGADVWRSRLAASWATISAELLEDAGQKLTEADVGRIETAKRMVEEMVAKQGSKINHDTFPFDPSDDYPATSYHYGNYKSGSRMVSALTTMSDRQAVSGTARPYPPNSDR